MNTSPPTTLSPIQAAIDSPTTENQIKYKVLISALNGLVSSTGQISFNHSDLAAALHKEEQSPYPKNKLLKFLREAEAAGVILLYGDDKAAPRMVSLASGPMATTSSGKQSEAVVSANVSNPKSGPSSNDAASHPGKLSSPSTFSVQLQDLYAR
jgi:hypothetical protein